jgi:hypothetical protein
MRSKHSLKKLVLLWKLSNPRLYLGNSCARG